MRQLPVDHRLAELLAAADKARELLPTGAPEVQQTLDDLHRDIGRHLHRLHEALARQEPEPEPSQSTGSSLGTRWFTDEVATSSEPLFTPEDGLETARLPPAPLSAPERASFLRAPFVGELRQLLTTLTSAEEAGLDLTVEGSRLQWATADLDTSWRSFPRPVRIALLGLLGARARRLLGSRPRSAGGKRVLQRLERYREQGGLPPVNALLAEPRPELESWAHDARAWWSLLHDALRPTG